MRKKAQKSQTRGGPSFQIRFFCDSRVFQRVRAVDTSEKWQVREGKNFRVKFVAADAKRRLEFLLSALNDFPTSVNIRFCDVEEMTATNGHFRGKNYVTDVLSFPAKPGALDETNGEALAQASQVTGRSPQARTLLRAKPIRYQMGDLLICLPVCREQGRARRLNLAAEVERMIIHGLVHLKGLDHERGEAAWRVMNALERALARELRLEFGEPKWLQEV